MSVNNRLILFTFTCAYLFQMKKKPTQSCYECSEAICWILILIFVRQSVVFIEGDDQHFPLVTIVDVFSITV